MGTKKSTMIILLGVAVFLAGGALLAILFIGGGSSKSSSKQPAASSATTTSTSVPGARTFTATPTTVIQFDIPKGDNALSLQMDYFGGVGGYVRPNDLINIYAVINKNCVDPKFPLLVKLVQSNVKVLEVIGQPPVQAGQPGSFLLAVTPQAAEQLIFLKTGMALYFTLTTGTQPAASTAGVSCSNAF